jgi:hypothetical protein
MSDAEWWQLAPVTKRWVVKRTFAWMERNRRLSNDDERTFTSLLRSDDQTHQHHVAPATTRPRQKTKKFHDRDKLQKT